MDDTQRVLDAIRKIVQLLREAARNTEKSLGITPAQLFALQRMRPDQAISVNELASRTFTHQSSVSVVVKRLVERGLVRSAPSPVDGRRVALSLTKEGAAMVERAPASLQGRVILGLEKMAGPEREQLAVLLDRLLDSMGVDIEEPHMLGEEPTPAHKDKSRPGMEDKG